MLSLWLILASIRGCETLIYYLGPEGSYSHEAALLIDSEPVAVTSIKDVFQKSIAHRGIVPWENSLEGSVSETLDLLLETKLSVVGELTLDICHCLLGNKKAKIVYSHPQAIGQCREYLYKHNLEAIAVTSTAQGVVEAKKRDALAIGSQQAAKTYNLPIIDRCIQDRNDNSTRFAILGEVIPKATGIDKTSIIFATFNDKPGALYQILEIFAKEEINLTRIESRPTKRFLGEYLFHVDLEGHIKDSKIDSVLKEVAKRTSFLKILGSYPQWPKQCQNQS